MVSVSFGSPTCEESAVNIIEATEPEFIECGEWWGDCSAGQEVGAGCMVECDDGSSDAVFIHCYEVECRATEDGVSAQWEVVADVGFAICRQNAVDVVEAQQPDFIECHKKDGDCSAGQHVGAGCTVECVDGSSDPAFATCQDIRCVSLGGQVAAGWQIITDVDC